MLTRALIVALTLASLAASWRFFLLILRHCITAHEQDAAMFIWLSFSMAAAGCGAVAWRRVSSAAAPIAPAGVYYQFRTVHTYGDNSRGKVLLVPAAKQDESAEEPIKRP